MAGADDPGGGGIFGDALLPKQPRHQQEGRRVGHRWRGLQPLEIDAGAGEPAHLFGRDQAGADELGDVVLILEK